jgi:hypothetical protein
MIKIIATIIFHSSQFHKTSLIMIAKNKNEKEKETHSCASEICLRLTK